MKTNNFEKQVQSAQRRWQLIQQDLRKSSNLSPELQAEIITELSVALEELRVATEELHQQNEQLIMARQEAETARQHYQELFEFAPDGYLVTDERGIIQEANQAAAKLFNIRKKYLVNKPIDIFLNKKISDIFDEKLSNITQTTAKISNKKQSESLVKNLEILLQPREKEPIPIAVSISASCNTEGQIIRLRWLLKDVSERKQAEEKIHEQVALLDVATDAIFVQDLQDRVIFWNKAAELLYGWTKQEAIGQNLNSFLPPESLPKLAEIYQALFEKSHWQGELNQVTKTDKEIIVESRWSIVRDEENNLKSILVVNTDITLAKQLEVERLRNQRLEIIGSLASGISHDLNNILTPILGIAQLLVRKFPETDARTQKMLKTVEINAQRGAGLLKQILMFSRGTQRKQSIVLVSSLISEINQITRETFPKYITIYQDIPPNLWAINGDVTQLHQVLMNLCLNARDAMPNGGTLKISAENLLVDKYYASLEPEAKVGPYVVITVSDTGIGIPSEIKNRIFDPFFTHKELGKGTGLGLSIVLNIVKNHEGFIKVSSEVGKGTQFKVFLPAVETTAVTLQNYLDIPLGNESLILIVDDEVDIIDTTKNLLESHNYQVLTANNGIEAIAIYAQNNEKIAAVLMDMVMPSMDGVTAISTLQKINPQVKIIATSGLMSNEEIFPNIGNNVKAFLSKPYTSEELLTSLYDVVTDISH